MATVEQIENAILQVAGNPDSGSLKVLAPIMARAVAELDDPPAQKAKEKRIMHSSEIR
jgi:hypothetical protein